MRKMRARVGECRPNSKRGKKDNCVCALTRARGTKTGFGKRQPKTSLRSPLPRAAS